MTTADYPVTDRPFVVFQSGQRQPAYGLTNSGSSTIYLSGTPQNSTTDGWPLNPQATAPWPAGQYLSVVCATGQSSVLQTIDAPVGLFDPSAVATQLNLVGVPPIDQPSMIYTRTLSGSTAIASGATPPTTDGIDTTRYQGVYITGQEAGVTNLTATRVYTLTWYADSTLGGNVVTAQEQFTVPTYSATFQLQRPVRGAFLTIAMTSAVTTTPDAHILNVFGTMRNPSTRTYLTTGKNNSTGLLVAPTSGLEGITVWSGTITGVGASKTEYANSLMGCQMSLSFRSTATLSDILAVDLQTFAGQSYHSIALTPSIAFVNETLWMPPIPLSMFVINFSSGTPDFQLTLLAEPQ